MNRNDVTVLSQRSDSVLATNKVLRNTYLLLGMTFLFSALTAYASYAFAVKPLNPLLMIVGVYGLMFLTQALRNSALGIVSVFAFTGFLGYTLGPILNFYIASFSNGPQLIGTSLGATGMIFFALSGYVLTTRKDFSYLGGFLFVGIMVALLAMIAGIFFQIPALQLAISAAFVLISSGLILFQTSEIIHGGETNYISATVSLFVSIYNLFVSLLNLLSAFFRTRLIYVSST
ncbi:Bax inhibitor-1/YccA family protein [Legionella tunisiensis]|uniref:Bax inhibitor-1/YccA family protein n=1 Tax=Legionella tunisiensis TaxID=1034944 RepID=UPI00030E455D|nr:Bax inhibitor-1/YccA family protein [Legionella tunisiensis]